MICRGNEYMSLNKLEELRLDKTRKKSDYYISVKI